MECTPPVFFSDPSLCELEHFFASPSLAFLRGRLKTALRSNPDLVIRPPHPKLFLLSLSPALKTQDPSCLSDASLAFSFARHFLVS